MEEKWKQHFKDKLSGYRLEEVPLSWDDVGTAVAQTSRRKRVVAGLWSVAGIAAAVAAALWYVGSLRPSPAPAEPSLAVREETVPDAVPVVPLEVCPVPSERVPGAVHLKADPVPLLTDSVREGPSVLEDPVADADFPAAGKPTLADPGSAVPSDEDGRELFPVLQEAPAIRKPRLALLAYGSVPGSASSTQSAAGPVLSAASIYGDGGRMKRSGMLRMDENGRVETEEHHQQPVRFGLLFRYALTDRIGVGTGLTYSVCRSTFSSTYGTFRSETQQTLHFVGMPLRVDCRLLGTGPFRLYASAGGLAEKMVKGTVSMKPLQFSVNGAVGLDYALSRPVHLFFEPGCSYYFDNGSSVQTLHTQRPLSFQLDVGLRFQL